MMAESGYREIEHTADWELEVWAQDYPTLLERAAKGMYSLSGTRLVSDNSQMKHIELHAPDQETMLVDFLSELIWLAESENLAFEDYSISIDEDTLVADLVGAPIKEQTKEIKAVTFHNLKIERTDQGIKVRIVFDV